MTIHVYGLNHRTADVALREQMAFSAEGTATGLLMFHRRFPQCEIVLLSTCNRMELIVAHDDDQPTEAQVYQFLAEARDLPVNMFTRNMYHYRDEQAVRHVFRVASGLDSMVVGEYQIVSQLKQAYATASEQGTTGRTLNRLMHQAFSVSGRVRTETRIGERKVSIPSVAVDFAQHIFENFARMKVLVVGAGEMAQLVCKHLQALDVQQFIVTSRTLGNARALADACGTIAVPYDQLDEHLGQADIVIAAVRCPKAVLTADRVRQVKHVRRNRPLYIIDLALPRNVEPDVARLPNVYVQDIDQLGRVVAENEQARLDEIDTCEAILDEELEQFVRWVVESRTAPTIAQMYQDAAKLRDQEMERMFRSCPQLSEEERDAVAQMADRLIKKCMHPCTTVLRRDGANRSIVALAKALHELTEQQGSRKRRTDRGPRWSTEKTMARPTKTQDNC